VLAHLIGGRHQVPGFGDNPDVVLAVEQRFEVASHHLVIIRQNDEDRTVREPARRTVPVEFRD
jgi:hypothetical protein